MWEPLHQLPPRVPPHAATCSFSRGASWHDAAILACERRFAGEVLLRKAQQGGVGAQARQLAFRAEAPACVVEEGHG